MHWLTTGSTALGQPVQPVIDAAVGLWDALEFLKGRLPGKTPPLWQASLVGYILWPTVIGAFVWTLAPRITDWRAAWSREVRRVRGIRLVSVVPLAAMGIAFGIGIPGLVGVGIVTSPLSQHLRFREVFLTDGMGGGLLAWLMSLFGRTWASPVWGIAMTGISLVIVAATVGVVVVGYKMFRSNTAVTRLAGALVVATAGALVAGTWAHLTDQAAMPPAVVTFAVMMAVLAFAVISRPVAVAIHVAFTSLLIVAVLACMVWALIADPGFRITALGWLVILVVALAVQRIGVWRWNSWDHQERIESRSRWREGTRRRPLGRSFDISVFVLLGLSVLLGATAVALAVVDPRWWLLGLPAIGAVAFSIALGAAQDAINERALVSSVAAES